MRVLGIDFGRRRIGLALGDTETNLASPIAVIEVLTLEKAIVEIGRIVREEDVKEIILGVPHPLADQERETDQAREIFAFRDKLAVLDVPIIEENETLSTAQAERYGRELGEKKKRDDLAAVVILQTYLDRHGLSS